MAIHMSSATGFRHIDYQRPAMFAVLEGTQAGRVFVDRRDRPAAALIWSAACYLAMRFGFCVLRGESRVSSCPTVFVGVRMAETGVGTEELYRRQGVATLAAYAYLEHCLVNPVQPKWGCYYNVASEGLAQKLGFTNRRDVEVMYVHVAEDKRGQG
jgi:GNAT superfamily N-acetyltransferase